MFGLCADLSLILEMTDRLAFTNVMLSNLLNFFFLYVVKNVFIVHIKYKTSNNVSVCFRGAQ